MAISFIKNIEEGKYLNSHNNNIIEFVSDSTDTISNAVVQVNNFSFVLYPDPQGKFYFNLKDCITTLINTNNYADDLITDVSQNVLYSWNTRVVLDVILNIQINFTNGNIETNSKSLSFLLSSSNKYELRNKYIFDSNFVLNQKIDENNFYAKYFTGYPFDITVRGGNEGVVLSFKNLNNGITYSQEIEDLNQIGFQRLVFSDGRTDISLEDYLPLTTGLNNIVNTNEFAQTNIALEKECT